MSSPGKGSGPWVGEGMLVSLDRSPRTYSLHSRLCKALLAEDNGGKEEKSHLKFGNQKAVLLQNNESRAHMHGESNS